MPAVDVASNVSAIVPFPDVLWKVSAFEFAQSTSIVALPAPVIELIM